MAVIRNGYIAKAPRHKQERFRYDTAFRVKPNRRASSTGMVNIGAPEIFVPKELIGKRVRFKIEQIEDKESP